MDNLTHTLVGAVIGQAGLKRKTGLAMPALLIGANIPDVDVGCFVWLDGLEHLAFRRGITHGPPAMLLLPLVLAGTLWWFDRWQGRRGTRPEGRLPVRFSWLYALAFISCLSHPALDWLNNYGVRLLEPFSSRWFYGDTLFIADPWMWALLGGGLWFSLRWERADAAHWAGPAQAALLTALAYVGLNYAGSRHVEFLAASDVPYAEINVANPVPLAFWRREVLWRTESGIYGAFPCALLDCDRYPLAMHKSYAVTERLTHIAAANPQARAFLFWSRMPVIVKREGRSYLMDQRFLAFGGANRFAVDVGPAR